MAEWRQGSYGSGKFRDGERAVVTSGRASVTCEMGEKNIWFVFFVAQLIGFCGFWIILDFLQFISFFFIHRYGSL